jgi:methionyl-tRNA formyltransferase
MGGDRACMKIVFFGTPDYVLPVLATLHKKFVTGPGKSPIVAVVTQSPKPTGRKQMLTYSPVDKWGYEHKLPIFHSAQELLKEDLDFELGVLASYGEIIKKEVIDLFPNGILVIHPSLLPKYRGASPIPEAIKNGDVQTGVTIFKMDEKVDHGPIISQFKEDILAGDTSETLRARLFERSAEVLAELIEPYLQEKITPKIQDESQATFTKTVTKQDGYIDLKATDPLTTERFIKAMQPWPGAWTLIDNKRLKLLSSHLENGKLVLDEVQLEGKNPVTWKQFKEAYPSADVAAG